MSETKHSTAEQTPSFELNKEQMVQQRMADILKIAQDPEQLRSFAQAQIESEIAKNLKLNKALRDHLNPEVLNAMAFPERLLAYIKEVREQGGVLAIISSDLDNFKKFNDTAGHPAGDIVLGLAGDALRKAGKRATDTFEQVSASELMDVLDKKPEEPETFRKGGDEFIALWPGTEFVGALLVGAKAQNIFKENQAQAFPDMPNRPQVGMTIGIRLIDFSEERFEGDDKAIAKTALQDADDALYVAKQSQKGSILEFNPNDPRIIVRQSHRVG